MDPQNLLEKTAYWPFRFARIFGVWPFALQNRLLIFRWGSPGTILSILNLSIYITCYCLVGKNKHTIILRRLENPSTTHLDLVGQSAIANLKTFCVIFLYLSCLLNRHNFVRVWNNISRITTALANASQFCHLSSPALAQCEARNMKRQKYLTMYVLVLSLVHAAIEVAPISENLARHLKPSTAAQLSLVFFTWSFYSNMYAFFVAMLVGMVQTVEDCFAILSLSLHTLTTAESKPGTSPAVIVSNQNKPWDAKRVRHIIKFGQDLEMAVEEMNGRLKPQLLFVIAMMVFILTVGAFFAAKTIQSRLVNVDYFGTLVMVFLSYSIFHMFCRRCGGLITQVNVYENIIKHSEKVYTRIPE